MRRAYDSHEAAQGNMDYPQSVVITGVLEHMIDQARQRGESTAFRIAGRTAREQIRRTLPPNMRGGSVFKLVESDEETARTFNAVMGKTLGRIRERVIELEVAHASRRFSRALEQ
jgi:hypothetical protein